MSNESPVSPHQRIEPASMGGVPGEGTLTASSVVDAINSAEELICGDGLKETADAALGAALTGHRAATPLRLAESSPGGQTHLATGPWIQHRLEGDKAPLSGNSTFELIASDPQEAVDHCLVAHHIAAAISAPGACVIDRGSAESLRLLRLPDQGMIAAVMGGHRASTSANGWPPSPARSDRILKAASEAFAAVSARTGRPCGPLFVRSDGTSRYAVVCTGSSSATAERAAALLDAAGVAIRVIVVALRHPAPTDELQRALAGVKSVVVLEPLRRHRGDNLTAHVRSALWGITDAPVRSIIHPPESDVDLASGIGLALGFEQAMSDNPSRSYRGPTVTVGITPGGSRAEKLLLELAAVVGRIGNLHLSRLDVPGAVTLVFGRHPDGGDSERTLDLLILSNLDCLKTPGPLSSVRHGGTALVLAAAEILESRLAPALRSMIIERNIRLCSLDLSEMSNDESPSPTSLIAALSSAVLYAEPALGRLAGCDGSVVEQLLQLDRDPFDSVDIALLRDGASAVRSIDVNRGGELLISDRDLPLMSRSPEGEQSQPWLRALRHFHLTGQGANSSADLLGLLPLRPSALKPVQAAPYPLVFAKNDGDGRLPVTFAGLVESAVGILSERAGNVPLLKQHQARLVSAAGAITEERIRPLRKVFDEAVILFRTGLDISEAGLKALNAELALLTGELRLDGFAVGSAGPALLFLTVTAFRHGRAARLQQFAAEVKDLVRRLDELIRLDDSHETTAASTLSASLGEGAQTYVDTDALLQSLPARHGSKRLGNERRARILRALGVLQRFLREAPNRPELVIFHSRQLQLSELIPDGALIVEHTAGMQAAVGYFDKQASEIVVTLRAARIARLETAGTYDAEHEGILARMTWQSLTREELELCPPVIVMENAAQLVSRSMSSLSALLRCGRPVHLVVTDSLTPENGVDSLPEFDPGLGAYLAMAHREAFALQGTLAQPIQLFDGLRRLVAAPRPSVAFVTVFPQFTWSPWIALDAAHTARATPSLTFDPDAGIHWTDRLDLSANPSPDDTWTSVETDIVNEAGKRHTVVEQFTFAHAAAVIDEYRSHFRLVPTVAWNDEQLEISEYLLANPEVQAVSVPYLWVVSYDGNLGRAVMTREMAFACVDRMRSWRALQESAGIQNVSSQADLALPVISTAEPARGDPMPQEQIGGLDREPKATREAVEQLVWALLGQKGMPTNAGPEPPELAPDAAIANGSEGDESGSRPDDRVESVDEPYIDSAMCTTCHDCINLNNRMFRYSEDKQAYIADAQAGTFSQLVKAAEACPALCIHPGKPRTADRTATPELVVRAARFS